MKNTLRFLIVTLSFLVLPLIATAQNGTPEAGRQDSLPVMDTTDHTPNMIYEYLETMPEFPGGTMALYEFINTNLQYPEAAKKQKIEGNVYAKFVVTEDGSIINIAVLRDIGGGCGEEAVRVLSTMPKWKPGMQNGKPAAVFYMLPIKFALSD